METREQSVDEAPAKDGRARNKSNSHKLLLRSGRQEGYILTNSDTCTGFPRSFPHDLRTTILTGIVNYCDIHTGERDYYCVV